MMTKAGLLQYIDLILSNEDVVNSKPDPETYIKAMEKLHVEADECIILEDNKNGIQAAIASGGHLLQVNDVYDVNYYNIIDFIHEVESENR